MMLDDMEDIVADVINGGHGVEQDGVSIGDEPLFTDELTQCLNEMTKQINDGAYMQLEDKILCEAWMTIGQEPICDAKEKGGA
jgi:hypothetical protein